MTKPPAPVQIIFPEGSVRRFLLAWGRNALVQPEPASTSRVELREGTLMWRAILVSLSMLGVPHFTAGQTTGEKKATTAYLRGLQTRGGGFLPAKPAPKGGVSRPSLRATSAAIRALKYFGGEVPDRKAAVQFVQSSYLPSQGGFGDSPGARSPDVVTTAVGIMAVVELKMPPATYVAAVRYLDQHAQSFEEMRIAAAGLESLQKRPAQATQWLKRLARLRNRDGTYGKGSGLARLTGSAVVTVLRLGGKVEHRERVLQALRDGQRQDGGFGKEDVAGSDLETCYRVMRALVMLKGKPADGAAVRRLVGRCRNADGGYGLAPGQPSAVAPTYFAAAVLHWLAGQ